MKRNLIHAMGVLGIAVLGGFGMVHVADAASASSLDYAPNSDITVLSCTFQKDGPKGDCQQCTATFVVAPPEAGVTRSPNNTFTVICGDDTIYASGAFTQGGEVSGNPDFGSSVVTAIPNIQAGYPAVWVDADFLDDAHSFHDVDSRLRLSGHDVLFGKCDHEAIVRPLPPR